MTSETNNLTYIYNGIKYDFPLINLNKDMLNNRLLCTFTPPNEVYDLVNYLKNKYTILHNKIFVLEIIGKDSEVCLTYNIDHCNINGMIENSILVHRKKESNTLYTINSLNELIKKLNYGILDSKYIIPWNNYKNSILFTQHNEFHHLNTKIKNIIGV